MQVRGKKGSKKRKDDGKGVRWRGGGGFKGHLASGRVVQFVDNQSVAPVHK